MAFNRNTVSIGIVLVLAACSQEGAPPQVQMIAPLSGEWALEDIRCGGEPSSILPDSTFSDGSPVASGLTLSNDTGSRSWKLPGCTITIPLVSIVYPKDGEMVLTELAARCEGSCEPFPACSSPTDRPNQHFVFSQPDGAGLRIQLDQESLKGDSSPCGTDQSTENVYLDYEKK